MIGMHFCILNAHLSYVLDFFLFLACNPYLGLKKKTCTCLCDYSAFILSIIQAFCDQGPVQQGKGDRRGQVGQPYQPLSSRIHGSLLLTYFT